MRSQYAWLRLRCWSARAWCLSLSLGGALSAAACAGDDPIGSSSENDSRDANEGADLRNDDDADQEVATADLGSALTQTCGNGEWEGTEECDTAGPTEACTSTCLLSSMSVRSEAITGRWRSLGGTRHPAAANAFGASVAFLEGFGSSENDSEAAAAAEEGTTVPPELWVSLFDVNGARLGEAIVGAGFTGTRIAAPALAAIGENRYIAATSVLDADADESGVVLQIVSFSSTDGVTAGPARVANETEAFTQADPDLIWLGNELVVAWVDTSDAVSGPDLRYRTFDENLEPTSTEQTLAKGVGADAQVTLSKFGETWAAAYRGMASEGEVLTVIAPELNLGWQSTTHFSAREQDRPTLVELGSGRLLTVFTEQLQTAGNDSPSTGRLLALVLHEDNADEAGLAPCVVPLPNDPNFAVGVSQGHPTLSRTGSNAVLAWRSQGLAGNANGEELWRRSVSWASGNGSCADLTWATPAAVVGATERGADQRRPAFFSAGGTAITAWEDYGDPFAVAALPDVVVRVAPVQELCTVEEPCDWGEGHCTADNQCMPGLRCGSHNGSAFGKRSSLNACIPCGNGLVEEGEACDSVVVSPNCDPDCSLSVCGDGYVNTAGEQCDPGLPGSDTATCTRFCMTSSCGDGYVNSVANEACEPTVASQNSASCDLDCSLPVCGDGIVNTAAGEVCETNNQYCSTDCRAINQPTDCGGVGCPTLKTRWSSTTTDGEVHVFVQITNTSTTQNLSLANFKLRYWLVDSNTAPWQISLYNGTQYANVSASQVISLTPAVTGANKYVRVPLLGTLGPGASTSQMDFSFHHTTWAAMNDTDDYSYIPGYLASTLVSNPKITLYYQEQLAWGVEPGTSAVCGNGIREGAEACDTAGASATCDTDCTAPSCGDGIVNTPAGENCDPGVNPNCLPNCSGLLCVNAATCLHVQYDNYSDDNPDDQQIKVAVRVVNNGTTSINLNQLKLSYWFQHEPAGGGSFATACDWAAIDGGCGVVNSNLGINSVSPARPGADKRWDFGFQNSGTLAPGQSTGEIKVHLQNTWWNNLNDTNDYSYSVVPDSFAVTNKITAYLSGTRVWGQEP